jgi:hypothetical protein
MRERRNTREPLEEVKRHALAFEKSTGVSMDRRDAGSFFEVVTVRVKQLKIVNTATLFIDERQHSRARQHQMVPREKYSRGLAVGRYTGLGRDVSRSDVFSERSADGVHDLRMGITHSADPQPG